MQWERLHTLFDTIEVAVKDAIWRTSYIWVDKDIDHIYKMTAELLDTEWTAKLLLGTAWMAELLLSTETTAQLTKLSDNRYNMKRNTRLFVC